MKVALGLLAAVVMVGAAPAALAHHPDPGGESFPDEGVVKDLQHGPAAGHLPAVNRNVEMVGKAGITNPAGHGIEGRVADVAALGNYAYLTAFRSPVCEAGGVHVMDISTPAAPFEVTGSFMPTTAGSYAGEGMQVLRVANPSFTGDLLLHQNETCPEAPPANVPGTRGGINLWDVSNPLAPQRLAAHAGDYTAPDGSAEAQANSTHSMFAWTNVFDGRTYVVLIDNEERADLDIMDITDPRNPVMVNDTLDLVALFGVDQPTPANLRSVFSHDMVVKRVGSRYVMSASYWDGGYVLLDVTNPAEGAVTLIAETDFPALDEERLARGHQISPEGNAHQSELSPSNRFLIGTDEDFNPYRVVATINAGPYAGTEFSATSGSAVPPIDESTSISGAPTFVGLACDPLPAGTGVALIERGVCGFQVKLDNIKAAGYTAGVVFNNARSDCMAQVRMLAAGDIPFVFVDRLTGLRILQVPGASEANACTTATPAPGTAAAAITIEAIFDGWGYVRLFRTQIPGDVGEPGRIDQIDTYAVPESQDPAYAKGFGHLSVHEVAMDPNPGTSLAYLSYYSAGFRVVKYGNKGIQEVGAFIDEGGNNFWGVEVHNIGGQQYVLASDRDHGLYIFRYTGT